MINISSATLFDRSFYIVLNQILGAQSTLLGICRWIGAICFVLAVSIGAIKCMINNKSVQELLAEILVALCGYFIMMWAFPKAMVNLRPLVMDIALDAQSGQTIDIKPSDGKSSDDFYRWVAENTKGIFSGKNDETPSVQEIKQNMGFNIIDKEGYISINQTFKYYLAVWTIFWGKAVRGNGFSLAALGNILLGIGVLFVTVFAGFSILFNYITCMVDYTFLQTYGLLMIPMSLWSGTKSFTENLIGGIGKIAVKLLIISAILFICVFGTIDMLLEIFMLTDDTSEFFQLCLDLSFRSLMYFMISKQATSIAGFLSGGMPQLSFGEFVQAAAQTGAAAAATGAVMGAGLKAAGGAAAAGTKGVQAAVGGAMAAHSSGGGAAAMAAGAGQGLAKSIGGSATSAGKSMASSLLSGGAGKAAKNGMGRSSAMLGAGGALSSESIGSMKGGSGGVSAGAGSQSGENSALPAGQNDASGGSSGNSKLAEKGYNAQEKDKKITGQKLNQALGSKDKIGALHGIAQQAQGSDSALTRLSGDMLNFGTNVAESLSSAGKEKRADLQKESANMSAAADEAAKNGDGQHAGEYKDAAASLQAKADSYTVKGALKTLGQNSSKDEYVRAGGTMKMDASALQAADNAAKQTDSKSNKSGTPHKSKSSTRKYKNRKGKK